MNPTMVQYQLADLHRQEMMQQAEQERIAQYAAQAESRNLLRPVAQRLVQIGEKLQETTPLSWSLVQPEPHLVK